MDFAIIPRTVIEHLVLDPRRRIHLNVLLSHLLLMGAAMACAYHPGVLSVVPHICLLKGLCGVPCPGCGVTRSALAVLKGDLGTAWALNPGGVFLAASVALQIPIRLVAICEVECDASVARASRMMTAAVLIVLILEWVRRVS